MSPVGTFDPRTVTRPDRALLHYYFWTAAATVVAFPFVFLPLWARYRTLRYRFAEDGVSMSRGIFHRREVHLTYRRIQDINVTRNLLQRWLGIATLSVQTASGAAGAEMEIEGITRPEALRDFLYGRMRGAREENGGGVPGESDAGDEALTLLREIRDELRRLGRGS